MSETKLSWTEHTLEFIKPASTSRGAYTEKKITLLTLQYAGKTGIGEVSPLPDLSIDGAVDLRQKLEEIRLQLIEGHSIPEVLNHLEKFPSIQFGLECAWLQANSKNGLLYNTPFTHGKQGITINGLVWMNDLEQMERDANEKIAAGFHCIKFKVGMHDHDEECRLLEKIRKKNSAFKLEIRLDANGAYPIQDARHILKDLARFEIHSIEQPIGSGQWEAMAELCADSQLAIALDEELIGIERHTLGNKMLKTIKPDYVILKPTLLGGFSVCDDWIKIAFAQNTDWWATSALESNIGLGHIAQWVSSKDNPLPQGLGTGALYKKNLRASTILSGDMLWFPAAASNA
jgi:o-succinylbenzoate synthase